MAAWYNEHDRFAAQWLRNLIAEGLIADGEVDERDIQEVQPGDLAGFTQCHFFAGIGGWSLALRLAGWPGDQPVWTGSCPCQPFSSAGAQVGGDDPRHLWPSWARLIRECRPGVVFGEQVESAIAHGWLDLVCDDLERDGYAVGACGLPAASVGAFHLRQRLWFVADAGQEQRRRWPVECASGRQDAAERSEAAIHDQRRGEVGDLGYADSAGCLRIGLSEHAALEGARGLQPGGSSVGRQWDGAEWLACRDGKTRPTQPGIFPLAHGVLNRLGTLRGAGNAIVPQVAAQFIGAYLDSLSST